MNEPTSNDSLPLSAEGQHLDAPANDANVRWDGASKPLPNDAVIILPVRNMVLFPGIVVPLTVGRERSRAAAQEAVRLQRPLGILLQVKPDVEQPKPEDLHWVGTTATVIRYVTGPEGPHHAICQGQQRFRVLQFLKGHPFPVHRLQLIEEAVAGDPQIEGRGRALKQRAAEILELLPQVPEEMGTVLQGIEGPGKLADVIQGLMDIGE